MATASLATTRSLAKQSALAAVGVDHVLVDDGAVAPQVRRLFPEGVDLALEPVGTPTLPDTLRALRRRGVACFTGMLSNEWTVKEFYPIGYLPNTVRLCAYPGEAADLPAAVLQQYLDEVASGKLSVPVDKVYAFDEIVDAHRAMEHNEAKGKLVVVV